MKMVNKVPKEDVHIIEEFVVNWKNRELFDFIGEGHDAEVYRYKQYAIKIFKEGENTSCIDPDIFEAAGDAFPNIPKLYFYEYGEYMVMEFIHGKVLADKGVNRIEEMRFLPDYLKRDLLNGIEKLLERGVFPADVHLLNVIHCKKEDRLKIVDLGRFYMYDGPHKVTAVECYKIECRAYNALTNNVRSKKAA